MAVRIQVGDKLMSAEQIRATWQWKKLTRQVCVPGSICYLCGRPILFGLRRWHPRGPSLDHIVPLEAGGAPFDLGNVRPACFGCNSAKGARRRVRLETHCSDW